MRVTELPIAGAWTFEPPVFPDARGVFAAPFQSTAFRSALGFDLTVAQTNHSMSARGVIRGVHFADTPPGQAKYVYCPRGALLDVIVDVRVGSPTFGCFEAVELDAASCRAVYLAEGLGHAFVALTDDTVMSYLCSTPYNPTGEHGVSPVDPELGLPWPSDVVPVLSDKDAAAPTLAEAAERGLLPRWDACVEWYAELRLRAREC
ncbi:dTDP-4-dehydrorhamnose 3,5-epimerase family protein [Pseudonocardia sp. H11422]|uniref:dTDP-4-dehydrorhamnose 3,5-epimerase family protein n=1 Tax=Pseudonocardia sp. H11422 TaxID=2835866 RepID=UPI001BDC6D1C|nr:dTDP-4-dehydrorhamnose 3,5-epimerase family protein [Pseudonocardia sp. H11422]